MPDSPGRDPRTGGGDSPPAHEAWGKLSLSHEVTQTHAPRHAPARAHRPGRRGGGGCGEPRRPALPRGRTLALPRLPVHGAGPRTGGSGSPRRSPARRAPAGRPRGPFYTPGTPRRSNLREPGTTGEPLVFEGLVLTPDCRPAAGAVIDIWHCDERGRYDNDGFRYRGHQFTDGAGAFRFETIRSKRYGGRTAHIHVMVQGEATRLLTTQVYFPDFEAANARDSIFRDDLVMRLDRPGADGVWRGRFDFVLAPA